jgi:hypothetical protein
MTELLYLTTISLTSGPEVEFLDEIGKKSLKNFPPYYSQSLLLTDFTPFPPALEQKWFKTDL